MDAVGIVLDGVALATPLLPGGASLGIKVARGADKANDARSAAKATDAAQGGVHGNAKASTKPQHRYEIHDKNGDVGKTGISGQPLNKNGTSPRANQQVNKLNKAEGDAAYSATVKETNLPGRQAGLDAEQAATNSLAKEGNSLRLQKRPEPAE